MVWSTDLAAARPWTYWTAPAWLAATIHRPPRGRSVPAGRPVDVPERQAA